MILHNSDRFAEALIMNDLPLPEELDCIPDVGVVDQPEDVVVAQAGFLLCCQILKKIGQHVSGGGKLCSVEGIAGGSLGVDAGGVIHKIGVEAGFFDLADRKIPGQLIEDGRDHFYMGQLFGAQRSIGNVPMYQIRGQA